MKKRLHVLLVSDNFYPSFDGPTIVIENLAKETNNNNNDFAEILVPKFKNHTDKVDLKITRIKSFPFIDGYRFSLPCLDKKLKKLFDENKFDIVHVHSPFILGRAALKLAKQKHIPTVFTMHTKFKEDFKRLLKTKIARTFAMKYIMKTINMADSITTVSNAHINVLRDYGYKKPVKVIRNGTDLTVPENPKQLIQKIKETYNLGLTENILLFVGRLVSNKRLDFIMKILGKLKKKLIDFKFVFVGCGSFENKLKQMTEELNLEQNVVFTGKIFSRELISGIYLASDLLIFPSIYDVASLTIMEAASLGLPALLAKGSSTAEVVTNNDTGFLCEGDENEWANKIEKLLKNKDRLKQVGKQAQQKIAKSWKDIANETLIHYKEIINNKIK